VGGISGFVVDNTNRPLASVTVELRDAAQNRLDSMLTDASGQYAFNSVVTGGTYLVRVVPPPGFTVQQVSPSPPATASGSSGILITNFNPGISYANNNFVLGASAVVSPVTPGSANAISGKVINDLNGNGIFNAGEPGLAGATLTLVATTGVSFGTTVTGSGGDFTFVNLPAGTYTLTRTNPAGFVSTGVQPGVGGTSLNLDTIQVGVTGTNNLFSGQLFLATASSVVSPTVGTISGAVVNVATGLPIPGVTIELFTGLGFVDQTTTAANGAYTFANKPPGSYQVLQLLPTGLTSVAAVPGINGANIPGTTTELAVTVVADVNSANNNFLDATTAPPQLVAISGSVIQDTKGDNVVDVPPDLLLPGVQILLEDQFGTTTLRSFTTDINGAWAFRNLSPGTYRVVQLVPANFVAIGAFPGTAGGVPLSPSVLQVTVSSGESGNNDFLDRATVVSPTGGTISGFVFQDLTGNGVGNRPLAGVTIQLFTQLGFIAQTTTDANGAYAFPNVAPGFYQVFQVLPSGLVSEGANPLAVTAVSGVNQGNNNFLDRASSPGAGGNTISGFAIHDLNLNGIADNEPGLAGMLVVISDQFGNSLASVVTDSTGIFRFTNVPAGTFTLTATPPAGLFSTNAIPGQGGMRLSANSISVTTTAGITNYPGQLFLAGP
jgi:hypothetical protein